VSSPATTTLETGPSSLSSDFEFIKRYTVIDYPEYWIELDEYRTPQGEQFMLVHTRFAEFSKALLKRFEHEWRTLRACVPGFLFCIGEVDDDKFERFVARQGFKFFRNVVCTNGIARRLFISIPTDTHERLSKTDHD
jgi:hypothetical protein